MLFSCTNLITCFRSWTIWKKSSPRILMMKKLRRSARTWCLRRNMKNWRYFGDNSQVWVRLGVLKICWQQFDYFFFWAILYRRLAIIRATASCRLALNSEVVLISKHSHRFLSQEVLLPDIRHPKIFPCGNIWSNQLPQKEGFLFSLHIMWPQC